MGTTWKRGKKSHSTKFKARKQGALDRLKLQLKAGEANGVSLTIKDQTRIEKEITILESLI